MGNVTEPANPKTFFVVGIGASAGGLRALEEYFENMPSDSHAAFVVVQHLSPDYKSLMSELLKRRTNMAVQQVIEQVSLTPNTVFLIPPGQNMVLENDHLHLMPQDRSQGRQPNFPIDRFFQSLSTEVREHTISIILSGTGSDGSRGIQEIAEMGGIVLAQDPATAEFDGMPQSAISTGVVDLVLAPNELAQATYQFVTSPHDLQAFRDDQENRLAPLQLQRIVNIVEQYENIDFTHYKPSTVTRRIERRCLIAGYRDLDSYIHRLETSEEERGALRNDLLITVTRFFRDGEAWRLLEESILPELIQRLGSKQTLRIWITACATGEEAYSMAMLLRELLDKGPSSIDAKIFATDIDQVALSKASSGVYPASIINELGEDRLNRFFTPKDDSSFEVSRSLREMIIFASHNLAKDAGFTHMDLVSCRNVLIYMQPELQDQVLRNLHFALKAKGVLFLGESETLGKIEDEFISLHRKWKIYQKVRDVKLPLATQSVAALSIKQLRSYPAAAAAAPPPRFDPLLEAAFKTLLNQEKTTCLLSDRQNQLLYVCGDALNLLTVPNGRSSRDLIQMLPQSLQLPLSTALHRVRQGRENNVRYSGCQITDADRDDLTVTLEISQQAANRKTSEFYLVSITQERLSKVAQLPTQFEADTDTAQYVLQLEEELHRTRENLQATIEELETTNEEQQATNEELIASNEELQSTNEELQSVNEELYTVNAEYQSKIQELIQLNNDLDNLLGNVEVGVIFLDNELRIRKFTPAATVACNLVDADLHRPIGHLSHNLENFDLLDCLEQANQERQTVEREVQVRRQGPYLLMRIYPYLNENKTVDGLILTFVNIDEIKRTQLRLAAAETRLNQANEVLEQQVKNRTAELEASQHFLESINQTTPNNIYIYDLGERCNVYCNHPLEKTLGYTPEELQEMGSNLTASLFHPEDLDRVAAYHQSIAQSALTGSDSSGEIFKIEYRVRHADGRWRWLYNQDIVYQRNADGYPTQLLGTAVDISDRKEAEANLVSSE
ncbi:MAG: CheR family methyltransferase [Cyanobacteria bacterium P01_A01_bin.15]